MSSEQAENKGDQEFVVLDGRLEEKMAEKFNSDEPATKDDLAEALRMYAEEDEDWQQEALVFSDSDSSQGANLGLTKERAEKLRKNAKANFDPEKPRRFGLLKKWQIDSEQLN